MIFDLQVLLQWGDSGFCVGKAARAEGLGGEILCTLQTALMIGQQLLLTFGHVPSNTLYGKIRSLIVNFSRLTR